MAEQTQTTPRTPASSAWTPWKLGVDVLSFLLIAVARFGGFWWTIFRGLESAGYYPDCRPELYGTALGPTRRCAPSSSSAASSPRRSCGVARGPGWYRYSVSPWC